MTFNDLVAEKTVVPPLNRGFIDDLNFKNEHGFEMSEGGGL